MEDAGSSPAGGDPFCGLCQTRRAPYTCPRCHLRYCSVPCYRRHGSCARDFESREWELQLRGQRGDAASRRRLKEALARLQRLGEPGDEEAALGLRPSSALLEEELWEQLSPEQRKAFEGLLSSGQISALLPAWEPWWVGARSSGAPLVQELGPAEAQDPQSRGEPHQPPQPPQEASPGTQRPPHPSPVSSPVPTVAAAIPPLASLTRAPVSPLVRCQLPNVLFAYAYALALYNGDVDEDDAPLPEFCETILDASGALGAKQTFPSVPEALQAALQALAAGRYPECPLGNAGVMRAVAQILMGQCQAKQKEFTLAALSHLARLLSRGKRQVPTEDRPRVYGAQKKCEFLLSWVNENEAELTLLALEVQREYKAHKNVVEEVGAVTQELEKMWGGKIPPPQKPLIEELD